jgi:hypothetical protein
MREDLREINLKAMQSQTIVRGLLARNAVGATSRVLRFTMWQQPGEFADESRGNDMDLDWLSDLNVLRFAKLTAGLRTDELMHRLPEYADADAAGNVTFHRDRVPAELPPPTPPTDLHDPVVLHQARLMCPALYVSGMIPQMLGIVPQILRRTQEIIDSKNVEWDAATYGWNGSYTN